ncbi:hypothetical protein HDU84_003781 [Entophlyctis sp. JEL0112]|nr:hypothetical protein HDU84_003781 [Entophlyctis sp. JEL0112]
MKNKNNKRLDIKRGQQYNFGFVEFDEKRDAEDAPKDCDGKESSLPKAQAASAASATEIQTNVSNAAKRVILQGIAEKEETDMVVGEEMTDAAMTLETEGTVPHRRDVETIVVATMTVIRTVAGTTATDRHQEETIGTGARRDATALCGNEGNETRRHGAGVA